MPGFNEAKLKGSVHLLSLCAHWCLRKTLLTCTKCLVWPHITFTTVTTVESCPRQSFSLNSEIRWWIQSNWQQNKHTSTILLRLVAETLEESTSLYIFNTLKVHRCIENVHNITTCECDLMVCEHPAASLDQCSVRQRRWWMQLPDSCKQANYTDEKILLKITVFFHELHRRKKKKSWMNFAVIAINYAKWKKWEFSGL